MMLCKLNECNNFFQFRNKSFVLHTKKNSKQKPVCLAMVCQCIRFGHNHLISYELTRKKNVKVQFAV